MVEDNNKFSISNVKAWNKAERSVQAGGQTLRVREPCTLVASDIVQDFAELRNMPSRDAEIAFRRKLVSATWTTPDRDNLVVHLCSDEGADELLDNLPWSIFEALYNTAFSMVFDSQGTQQQEQGGI